MEIKHNKKKEEMRHDPFLDAIAAARHYIEQNQQTVLAVAGAVLAVVIVVQVVFFVNRQAEVKAADLFGKATVLYAQDPKGARTAEALADVSSRYGGTVQGVYSAFLLGSIAYDKAAYDEAVTQFEIAARGTSRAGFVKGEAIEGLGKCAEAKGDYDRAAAYYEKVLADKAMAYRHPALMWRLALINAKLVRTDKASAYCTRILADTAAFDYRRKAEGLAAEIAAR